MAKGGASSIGSTLARAVQKLAEQTDGSIDENEGFAFDGESSQDDLPFKEAALPDSDIKVSPANPATVAAERAAARAAERSKQRKEDEKRSPSKTQSPRSKNLPAISSKTTPPVMPVESVKRSIGYLLRPFVLATFPHAKTDERDYIRMNGSYRLEMTGSKEYGLPWGKDARLISIWLTTEIYKTQNSRIYLGKTQSAFMKKCGLTPVTGKRGNMRSFKENLLALFYTSFTASFKDGKNKQGSINFEHSRIVRRGRLWWDEDDNGDSVVEAWIDLDESFYNEFKKGPIPLDLDAVMKLKYSSMALDIYCFLTYKFSQLKSPLMLSWRHLMLQFGTNIEREDVFMKDFQRHLKRVQEQYPEAKCFVDDSGIRLFPSKPHIPKKLVSQAS